MIVVASLFLVALLFAVLFYRRLRESFSRRSLFFLGAVLAAHFPTVNRMRETQGFSRGLP